MSNFFTKPEHLMGAWPFQYPKSHSPMTQSLLTEVKSLPEITNETLGDQLETLQKVYKDHPVLETITTSLATFMVAPEYKSKRQVAAIWHILTEAGYYLIDNNLHRHTLQYSTLLGMVSNFSTVMEFHHQHNHSALMWDWGENLTELTTLTLLMERTTDHIHICGLLADPELTVFKSENIALVIEPRLAITGEPDLFLAAKTKQGFWNFHADEFRNIKPSREEYEACVAAVNNYQGQTIVGSVVSDRASKFCTRCGLSVVNGLAYLGNPDKATYSQPLYNSRSYHNRNQRYKKAKDPITHRPKAKGFS